MRVIGGMVGMAKHVVGHAVGFVAVLVLLTVATGLLVSPDDESAVVLLAAALLWGLHLCFARADLDDDPRWIAACLRGMAWAARSGTLIFVPAVLYLALFAGLESTWDGPLAHGLAAWLDVPWLAEQVDPDAHSVIASSLVTLVGVVALGFVIEWVHAWAVVSLMTRRSSPMKKAAAELRRRRAARRELRRRTHRAEARAAVGPEARAVLDRNRRFRAWGWAEFLLPLLAMAAAVAFGAPDAVISNPELEPLELAVVTGLLWGGAAVVKRFRLATRTPFRQVRLVIGSMFALLGAIVAGLIGLLAPLGLAGTSRAGHWALVERIVDLAETLFASRHTVALLALLVVCEPIEATPLLFGFARGPMLAVLGVAAYLVTLAIVRGAKLVWLRLSHPVHLVLLRVFGDSDRARLLVDHIAPAWHGIGNVAFIGAPDTSVFTLDVSDVASVIFGQVRDRFISGWEVRDAMIERHLGRRHTGSNHDFLCFDDTWKPMLRRMLAVDAVVLMDLRAFSRANAGCVFELENLMERVPLHRVLLLVDDSTDRAFLDEALARAWSSMSDRSPNAHARAGEIVVFDMDDDSSRASRRLLELLAEAAARAA